MISLDLYQFVDHFINWIVSFLTIWFIWWILSKNVRQMEKIPGPPLIPVLGNALQLWKPTHEILKIHADWMRKYGKIYRFWIGFRRYVAISSSEDIQFILNNEEIINKSPIYHWIQPQIGNGLLLSRGSKWSLRRTLLDSIFKDGKINNFIDIFNQQTRTLIDRLTQHCGERIDIYPFITRYTLDVICESAFGMNSKAQEKDSKYFKAITRLNEILVQRFSQPLFYSEWIFPWTNLRKEQDRHLMISNNYVEKMINRRKQQLSRENSNCAPKSETKSAFVDTLLRPAENDSALTADQIREEMNTLLFLGHYTISSSICWFLYCMASNVKIQKRVREELQFIFGDSERICTIEDTKSMNYMDCCIRESLRLFPGIPFIERQLPNDLYIGGYDVPAGSFVVIPIYNIHRSERYYPNPDLFQPERFLNPEHVRRDSVFIPFSSGHRNCIGEQFALMEMKIILSTLLRHFTFEMTSTTKLLDPCSELILTSRQGFPLIISSHLV